MVFKTVATYCHVNDNVINAEHIDYKSFKISPSGKVRCFVRSRGQWFSLAWQSSAVYHRWFSASSPAVGNTDRTALLSRSTFYSPEKIIINTI